MDTLYSKTPQIFSWQFPAFDYLFDILQQLPISICVTFRIICLCQVLHSRYRQILKEALLSCFGRQWSVQWLRSLCSAIHGDLLNLFACTSFHNAIGLQGFLHNWPNHFEPSATKDKFVCLTITTTLLVF